MDVTGREAKLSEGKTKVIWSVGGKPELVDVENKNDITAFDDPSYTKIFSGKAAQATMTTSRVFELLRRKDMPVAFQMQSSETSFLAEKCEMIPLEVVVRRFAVGSYLKRVPVMATPEGELPYRFKDPLVEFFLKTTKGQLVVDNEVLVDGLNPLKGEEDPWIKNPFEVSWILRHSKKDADDPAGFIKKVEISRSWSLWGPMLEMEEVAKDSFLILERAWRKFGCHLIDLKVEFGQDVKGKIVLADVIDNDSWRLRDENWQELSKQAFRDGEPIEEVARKYALVAKMSESLK